MTKTQRYHYDPVFLQAEEWAGDLSLFPHAAGTGRASLLRGLLGTTAIADHIARLRQLGIDDYIAAAVQPAKTSSRPGAKAVITALGGEMLRVIDHGPLYACEVALDFGHTHRRIGIIAQNRTVNQGIWSPNEHLQVSALIRDFAHHKIPVVTMIDTPGAEASASANRRNQAHTISRLIAEMAQLDVPTVGIVIGNGYSGGAIPLATTNMLLSVRDGVFNTIQPQGLASIARKYNLSWQECAKYVGVSACELHQQGYLDGIIDFVPGEQQQLANLNAAITSAITAVEIEAEEFARRHPEVTGHYRESVQRFLTPSETLRTVQNLSPLSFSESPTGHLNLFGIIYRLQRYLKLRRRITFTTIESYARLSNQELPRGELQERLAREQQEAFTLWQQRPLEIKYDDRLQQAWDRYSRKRDAQHEARGSIATLLFGDPRKNYEKASSSLLLEYSFHLYNQWKAGCHNQFLFLLEYLNGHNGAPAPGRAVSTVIDVIQQPAIKDPFIAECRNLLVFDLVYDSIIKNLKQIARAAKDSNTISSETVHHLLETALGQATAELTAGDPIELKQVRRDFINWLFRFSRNPERGRFLKSVQAWKRAVHPRIPEPLFAIITFFFEELLLQFFEAELHGRPYRGQIAPRNIGMRDFWNRVHLAYQNLLFSDELTRIKRSGTITTERIITTFFTEFTEHDANLMTADPVHFPGFRLSIEKTLQAQLPACGIVTGIGTWQGTQGPHRVGAVISNLAFQAGAFDMASTEKFCRLLAACARQQLPVICFISSGGMQTKEGAGALFSMSIINDRITRFIRDNELPVICFGFGDCTGGAQASFVTHPLVQTYYLSGCNMPFAGQVVVPEPLPASATLANYLSTVPGAMQGLVKNPFAPDLDERLQRIDPNIPIARESVHTVVDRAISWDILPTAAQPETVSLPIAEGLRQPIRKVLIHARGCTAAKLVAKAKELGIHVVLVQSDADMDSVAAELLGPDDRLVCLGGNTPGESYLNPLSIIRIAEREQVDALHPGIGFLSENAHFAELCQRHYINFVGPPVTSMELMGNKSNAISTARRLGVPVVPGSFGSMTDGGAAARVAAEIGYPVIIKAVHGGGGKGIRVVTRPDDFRDAFQLMLAEARNAFGNSDVYIEKFVTSLRHVEVQILRDAHCNTRVLGLRDCSVQRNNQKIIEESGSTILPDDLRKNASRYATAMVDEIDFIGAGTVEFIYDLKDRALYFMEMNTRLQVEHPVTEAATGIDIVKEQFRIAGGESIAVLQPRETGYAMEVRINAEKPGADAGGTNFVPCSGTVTEYHMPTADHITVISTIGAGKDVPPYYDNMLVQVIGRGPDRATTIKRLINYLDQVRLEGIYTNLPLLRTILREPVFQSGIYDTNYLPAFLNNLASDLLISETERAAAIPDAGLTINTLMVSGSDEVKVLAPRAGVFYLSPSPAEPAFIGAGDLVSRDTTLGLLEVMKTYSAISLASYDRDNDTLYSSPAYRIIRITAASGQPVNSGDLLFIIRPEVSLDKNDI